MSQESTDLAQVLAIQAEIEAIKIEVRGMEVFNSQRESDGYALAYREEAFACMAKQIRKLSDKLRCM